MKIEIIRIFKESFRDVREHKMEWLRVAYAPIVIWLLGFLFSFFVGLSTGQSAWTSAAGSTTTSSGMGIVANIVYQICYFIALFTLYVNGFRYAVLKEGGDRWWTLNLNGRFVKMFLYSIYIGVLMVLYGGVAIGIAWGAYALTESIALTVILAAFLTLYGFYFLIRLGLTFLLVAIDRSQPMKTSWRLLQGHILRLTGLLMLIGLAIIGIGLAGAIVIALFGFLLTLISPSLVSIAVLAGVVFGIGVWIFSWALYSKSYALVYASFMEGRSF